MKTALIIFIKNAKKGHVKTRLASGVGEEAALRIYKRLLQHTRETVLSVPTARYLYYSQDIISNDEWDESEFDKRVQKGSDLGERMLQAFQEVLENHDKAVIIGSDCPGLSPDHITSAFVALDDDDVVFGPSLDGGYYLLGMKESQRILFENMQWSTKTVMEESMKRCTDSDLRMARLPALSDVDYKEDLEGFDWLLNERE